MKALTNILTRWMLMLLLLATSCTNDVAEVETPTQQGQYVTVRMNIPGMTATASRAADGMIETITALAFNSNDELLSVKTVTTITNVNANNGYNGNFNLTVPNGTTTIHFLANLPLKYSNEQTYVDFLNAKKGQSQIDVMTSLTTGDYNNLCYWGMANTWDGNTNPLNVTLYRNLAKISIKPSETDTEFNQFEQNQLIIAGLINPNRVGKLVPYNGSFFQGGNAPSYHTLPGNPNPLNVTPIGNEGAGYGNSLYVFEHENSNYKEYGLFVICKIDDYFYNVALTSDGINPYPIIRNHEYIIYVSDVDDYQTDEYRSTEYSEMYDAETSTMLKTPINLVVKQVAQVAFSPNTDQTINVDGYLDIQMTGNNIPNNSTVTLSIKAPGFTVSAQNSTPLTQNDDVWTYTGTITNFRFTPSSAGTKPIKISGEGVDINVTPADFIVTVNATITATANPSTIYYDGNNKTTTVSVIIPKGVTSLSISAPNFNYGGETSGSYTYTRTDDATTQTTVHLEFTLKEDIITNSTITFSDATNNEYVKNGEVSIKVTSTSTEAKEVTVWSGTSSTLSSSTPLHFPFTILNSVEANDYLCFEFTCSENSNNYWQIQFFGYNWNKLSVESKDFQITDTYYEFKLTTEDVTKIKENDALGVFLTGNGIVITRIYTKEQTNN